MNFKQFIESKNPDLDATLHKLPKKIQALLKGYKYTFTPDNSLKNDKGHVGVIDKDKKTIIISAPWNYGRELALLHEVGHLVWENLVSKEQKKEWILIVRGTKDKQDQSPEELFSFAFANHYVHMKVEIHSHPTWEKFIKKIV